MVETDGLVAREHGELFHGPSQDHARERVEVDLTMISDEEPSAASWATAPQRCVVFRMTMPA